MSRTTAAAGLRAADFERVLAKRPCARSEHFVLHHLAVAEDGVAGELSTPPGVPPTVLVDERLRFGLVIPKRHARRAVTRSLIKRQGRGAFQRCAGGLSAGDWVLRLRSPFSPAQFPSAASNALRAAVHGELAALFQIAAGGRR
ncbi:ribonuclease P protein component [Methylibium sp.]|uniref:ribonuclease P protein component n=1 Tax=Methylibium sp. TaxID=2067992 RepID=UPI003D10AFEA